MELGLHRRDLLKALGVGAFATLQLAAADPDRPLFFTKREFKLLDVLTDLIVPTDERSPGAHEAGVAAYIDRSVAEAFMPEERTSWRQGLASIDEKSKQMHHSAFLDTNKEQQVSLLKEIAAAENDPKTEPEKFFTQLKQTTAFAYYSSSIGIHQEMNYKGNVVLEQFAGYDAS